MVLWCKEMCLIMCCFSPLVNAVLVPLAPGNTTSTLVNVCRCFPVTQMCKRIGLWIIGFSPFQALCFAIQATYSRRNTFSLSSLGSSLCPGLRLYLVHSLIASISGVSICSQFRVVSVLMMLQSFYPLDVHVICDCVWKAVPETDLYNVDLHCVTMHCSSNCAGCITHAGAQYAWCT